MTNTAPLAVLAATPKEGTAPLAVAVGISGSDTDAGDSIASYSLDFNDGSAPLTDQADSYMPSLTVKDSRGLLSSNVARETIVVNAMGGGSSCSGGCSSGSVPSSSGPSPVQLASPGNPASVSNGRNTGRFGGGAFGLFALLPLLLAVRRCKV